MEEAGFKGIWGSGFTISSSLGVRDSNEVSWTQNMEILEYIADSTRLPILVDGDTGYGNFNNFRRLVRKLESRGLAGVCIEDKVFPKTNSFLTSPSQKLADCDEFCGKIKAGRDSQLDDDFVIVARTEALIAGHSMAETLRRAEAYRLAGADAILVHSKRTDSQEIDTFMKEWGGRHPIIICPTTYSSTPLNHFRSMKVSLVIWANQILRAAVVAMQRAAAEIYQAQNLSGVEQRIVPLSEVFRLQCAKELEEAEGKYLPPLLSIPQMPITDTVS